MAPLNFFFDTLPLFTAYHGDSFLDTGRFPGEATSTLLEITYAFEFHRDAPPLFFPPDDMFSCFFLLWEQPEIRVLLI